MDFDQGTAPLLGASREATLTAIDRVRLLHLGRDLFAAVDADKFDELATFRWHFTRAKLTTYAMRNAWNGCCWSTVKLHRQITRAGDDQVVDHWDHDGLNNTRANIRIATDAENCQSMLSANMRSGRYKGVSSKGSKWQAAIRVAGRLKYLGLFATDAAAAAAYNKAASEHFGEFALLNIVMNVPPPLDWAELIRAHGAEARRARLGIKKKMPAARKTSASLSENDKIEILRSPLPLTHLARRYGVDRKRLRGILADMVAGGLT